MRKLNTNKQKLPNMTKQKKLGEKKQKRLKTKKTEEVENERTKVTDHEQTEVAEDDKTEEAGKEEAEAEHERTEVAEEERTEASGKEQIGEEEAECKDDEEVDEDLDENGEKKEEIGKNEAKENGERREDMSKGEEGKKHKHETTKDVDLDENGKEKDNMGKNEAREKSYENKDKLKLGEVKKRADKDTPTAIKRLEDNLKDKEQCKADHQSGVRRVRRLVWCKEKWSFVQQVPPATTSLKLEFEILQNKDLIPFNKNIRVPDEPLSASHKKVTIDVKNCLDTGTGVLVTGRGQKEVMGLKIPNLYKDQTWAYTTNSGIQRMLGFLPVRVSTRDSRGDKHETHECLYFSDEVEETHISLQTLQDLGCITQHWPLPAP